MPARREYTAAELAERLQERRRQAREGMARLRAQRRLTSPVNATPEAVNLTSPTSGAPAPTYADARSTAFLVTSVPSEQSKSTADLEQVRCVLEPLRGYAHDERLLQRLAARCPAVDLVLEAIGMAEWLNRPANRKRTCSKAFVSNWVKRAATAPTGRTEPQRGASEPRSALGRVLEQIATSPVAGPATWGSH
jgi:hypothetical protein